VDDEEEVLVLEPPLEPTPAETPEIPDGSTSEQNKVNSEFLEILLSNNSDDEDMSSQKTNTTIYKKYSKYGIREGYEFSETEHDPESDRPQLGSLYHQCKTARPLLLLTHALMLRLEKKPGVQKLSISRQLARSTAWGIVRYSTLSGVQGSQVTTLM
jgi:hypothetical protein